jgi:ribosomal protein S18 acetylase RimI-like enzyme
MKKIEKWQEGEEQYILNDGFMLKRADKFEFGVHETIYSNMDLELSFSWKKQTVGKINYDNHFWIFKGDKRVGGVHISPNLMGAFFMEAPYIVDRFTAIRALNNALLQWAGDDKNIRVYGVTPLDIEHYQKLGYRIKCERRVMIHPTETFDNINWGDDFTIKVPTMDDVPEIGKLFYESYSGGIDYEVFGKRSLEEANMDAERILNIYKSNNIIDGSTLVYDKNTNELIGACMAGITGYCDNDFSEIGDVVVKPAYRKSGIASNMIKQALTNLKKISPATILCVTIGNPAESVYHKMGFFSGVKFTNMYLK